MTGRRAFLRSAIGAVAATALIPRRTFGMQAAPSGQSAAPSQGARPGDGGRLGDPSVAGRPQEPTSAYDNDARIQALEKRLRCGCGCTLDVYTCRTTDFTCTYSPELHREIVALWEAGQREDAIVDAFVAKYGEETLMAPEPQGFNLAGYLVPAALVTALGATLVWALNRRTHLAAESAQPAPLHPGASVPSAPSALSAPSAPSALSALSAPPTTDELRALDRAIAEDDAAP